MRGLLATLLVVLVLPASALAHPLQAHVTVNGKRGTAIATANRTNLDVIAFDDGSVAGHPHANVQDYAAPPPPPPPPTTSSWRPYADTSPFNTRVLNPTVRSDSAAIVNRTLGYTAPAPLGPAPLTVDVDRCSDWQHPRYHAKATDPQYRVSLIENWGTSTEGHVIRIPAGARPAMGVNNPCANSWDGHMAIVQPDGWEYDFWQVRTLNTVPGGIGEIRAQFGGRLRIDGDGRGGGSTAPNFGLLAGRIRSEELINRDIPHALFMTVRCSNGTNVYPALGGGAGSRCADTTGAPPLGARFWLNYTDAEINALPVAEWKRTILRAFARYGAYFGDTGGPGFGLMLESPETYRRLGQADPLAAWAAGQPEMVLSNGKHTMRLEDPDIDWAGRLKVIQ